MFARRSLSSRPFHDRVDAGRQLASDPRILRYASKKGAGDGAETETETIVLALPRGGVPVAYEIASKLNVPLDLMLVRKLGIPFHEETAMGAIAMNGVKWINYDIIRRLRIPDASVGEVINRESKELDRRSVAYRGTKAYPRLEGRNVIIVDDGIATGATMKAALQSVKTLHPKRLIIAAPVGAPDSCADLTELADEVVCLQTPPMFAAVGQWYASFPQTDDVEVLELLRKAESFGK